MGARVLLVDDHVEMARLLADQLADEGYEVEVADGGAEALRIAGLRPPDVVITDLRMEEIDGLDVLAGIHAIDARTPVLIMTAFGAVESAVEAMRRGAWHYLTKPFHLDEVVLQVERALEGRRLKEDHAALSRLVGAREGLAGLVGNSPPMQRLYDLIERVAPAPLPVLVRGESGTGKELVARALHDRSPRAGHPFVAVNCTTLPDSLLESELFGHIKGAFTGAGNSRKGLFLEADGGTLFLDEIGDMPVALQARVLRVLEDQQIRPVGADSNRTVDVRVVAATHQPLETMVEQGRFRADLLYRLDGITLRIPPLRERREDVPVLAMHALARVRASFPASLARSLSPALLARLAQRPWGGNVRELHQLVRRMAVLATQEVLDLSDLEPTDLGSTGASPVPTAPDGAFMIAEPRPMRQVEDDYLAWVLDRLGGNKTRAAEVLGIDASTIHRRVAKR